MILTKYTIPVLIFMSSTFSYCQSSGGDEDCKIQANQVEKMRAYDDEAIFIDVRTPQEYASGHLPSAINYDVKSSSFEENLKGLNKEAKIFLYCKAGIRSDRAQRIMQEIGFKNVCDIEGGIIKMVDEGVKLVY